MLHLLLVHVSFASSSKNPTRLNFPVIVAGGPKDAGLLVRSEGGYLGAEQCRLTEQREGGYRFRSVPALETALTQLSLLPR